MNGQAGGLAPPITGLGVPDLGGFERAWGLFIRAVGLLTRYRSEHGGVGRLGMMATTASDALIGMLDSAEVRSALGEHFSAAGEGMALSILTEEMEYFAWRYRAVDESLRIELEGSEDRWGDGEGDPLSDSAIDDAETIIGSVEKLLDKLPGPLKKLVHVLLEALKLTRGVV